MPSDESELRRLLDQMAIRDLHARYFQGCDRLSAEQIRSCFAENIEAHYPGGRVVQGLDEFMTLIFGPYLERRGRYAKVGSSSHFMGNLCFDRLEGDSAQTETYALISHVQQGSGADEISLRNTRYADSLQRKGVEWKICKRVVTLEWDCLVSGRPGDAGTHGAGKW